MPPDARRRSAAARVLPLAAVVLAATVLAAAAPARAQPLFDDPPLELAVRSWPDGPVVPGGPPVPVELAVDVDCRRVPPDGTEVRLSVEGDAPAWLDVSLDRRIPVEHDANCAATGRRETVVARGSIRVGTAAPAFEPARVEVQAHAGLVEQDGSDAVREVVVPGFLPGLAVDVHRDEVHIGPTDTARFPVTLTNQGNGPLLVTFAVEADRELRVPVPSQVQVPSPVTHGRNEAERTVTLQAAVDPDSGPGRHLVEVQVRSFYSRNAAFEGPSTSFALRVEVRGGLADVPWTAVLGVLALLGSVGGGFVLGRNARRTGAAPPGQTRLWDDRFGPRRRKP